MINKEPLNYYTENFKASLIGKWETIDGSFNLQYDSFEFFNDGTGIWISKAMRVCDKIRFKWRKNSDFKIDIKFKGNKDWETISYNFKKVTTDTGSHIILCQSHYDVFYLAVTKVEYSKASKSIRITLQNEIG